MCLVGDVGALARCHRTADTPSRGLPKCASAGLGTRDQFLGVQAQVWTRSCRPPELVTEGDRALSRRHSWLAVVCHRKKQTGTTEIKEFTLHPDFQLSHRPESTLCALNETKRFQSQQCYGRLCDVSLGL